MDRPEVDPQQGAVEPSDSMLLEQLATDVLRGAITIAPGAGALVDGLIARIDRLLSIQLDEILHHEAFQRLEASWRGLEYLLRQSETGESLKIKVLDVSMKVLRRDLVSAIEFDHSWLFKKVHSDVFGTFAGEPFGCLIGDYYFDRSEEDVQLLELLSEVAAGIHAPFLSAASPEMFGLESFTELSGLRDLARSFDDHSHDPRWRSFRDSEDSRWVALTVPRMLLRQPYGRETVPVEAFDYEEEVGESGHDEYLWGNAAYALGARVLQAFSRWGWCASIRGTVEGLPVHDLRTASGDTARKGPSEVPIDARHEIESVTLGFVPLLHEMGTDKARFFGVPSVQKPREYAILAASTSARLAGQLPYAFAVARFAHYLRVIVRDRIGRIVSPTEAERHLNRWISNYVVLDKEADIMIRCKKPLRQARVDLVEYPQGSGSYVAVAFLQPHFQLEELLHTLRVAVRLP
jgi:type VI secretion system protein ImpC